jgi:hypothetical protein
MKNLATALLFSSFLITTPVLASGGNNHGHDHGHAHTAISAQDAISKATAKIKQLAAAGKIDKSWAKISASSSEKKVFSHDPEWVITFKNDKVSDAKKQSLYLFYSTDGHYIAANYTGK